MGTCAICFTAMDWKESVASAVEAAYQDKVLPLMARETGVSEKMLNQLRYKKSLNAEELIKADKWLIEHGYKKDTLGVFGESRPPDILSLTGVKLEAIGRILQDTSLDDEARIEELGSIVPLSKRLQSLVAAFKKGNEVSEK